MEKKHEMMSLEDSEQLKGRMKFFEQELLKHHHIDPNLYVEYDVKRGLVILQVKVYLPVLLKFLMLPDISWSMADVFRQTVNCIIRESMYRIS
mgnify:CR=1 FL=1